MSPNRIVAVLTPLVFAPLAGAIATWIANNVPGAEVPARNLEEVFIGGALIGLAPAAQWLHGWQKYEARRAEEETAIELANVAAPPAAPVGGEAAGESDFEEDFVSEPEDFDVSMESDELDDLDALDEELFADELSETGR
jgi:hypothetical protein